MSTSTSILFLSWLKTINTLEWRAEHPYIPGWYLLMTCKLGNNTFYVKRIQDSPADFLDLVDDSPTMPIAAAQASARLLTQALHDAYVHDGKFVALRARRWLDTITEQIAGAGALIGALESVNTGGDPDVAHKALRKVPLSVKQLHDLRSSDLESSMREPVHV